jgi:hypothetical protein
VAIETLSDNVLLEIFDICLDNNEETDPWSAGHHEDQRYPYYAWHALVHGY